MVHRRQELERKEAEEELAQAKEEEEQQQQQQQQQQASGQQQQQQQQQQAKGQQQQHLAREEHDKENPSPAPLPPIEAKETQENGLLPSSKRFKSCFWSNKRTVVHNTRCEEMAPCGSPLSSSSPPRSVRRF